MAGVHNSMAGTLRMRSFICPNVRPQDAGCTCPGWRKTHNDGLPVTRPGPDRSNLLSSITLLPSTPPSFAHLMSQSPAPPPRCTPSSALDSLLSQSTGGMRTQQSKATCCCGRSQCAYLEHNNAALEGLEKDLQSAAHIGQALLARHEAYMAEAEEERLKMVAKIDGLESDKKELKLSNAKTIEENRYLLDQLEEMNNSVSSSDAQIKALTTTLDSTRKEMTKLSSLAAQASQLEAQLTAMEAEQLSLQTQVVTKIEESQSVTQRWRSAERTVSALSEQIDRIEKEAKEERAQHAEIMMRLEKRRVVEKELEMAAGRLKGAAAGPNIGRETGSGGVVSSFVREILQDNANLQMGIVELRDMLMGSNEQVENLREQMLLHQPANELPIDDTESPYLNSELLKTPTADIPDFHVHHHYHAAPESKARTPAIRRPRKKRYSTSPGFRTPSTGTQTPREPYSPLLRATPASSAATILSQTSVTVPPSAHPTNRWSSHSSQSTLPNVQSSVPDSPLSMYQDRSVFDTTDEGMDSSRPTSPASTVLDSPPFRPHHAKGISDLSLGNCQPAVAPSISDVLYSSKERPRASFGESTAFPLLDPDTIPEETEDESSRPSTMDTDQSPPEIQDFKAFETMRPRLHRANSAESILSTRGVDIAIVHRKHSQLLSAPRTSLGSSVASVGPVTSSTSAVARPYKGSKHYDSSSYNRLLLTNASASSFSSTSMGHSPSTVRPTLGKKLGGWMSGKWGVAPTDSPSTGDLRAKASLSAFNGPRSVSLGACDKKQKTVSRMSTHVEPIKVDSTALEEALEGG